jgi:hypothetical protein
MNFLKNTALLLSGLLLSAQAQSADGVTLDSASGDTLMLHRLNNGELWGSFIITDQVVDSFADHELIVMQIDQHQPIKLDYQKQCGGGAREEQQVSFSFETTPSEEGWQFSRLEKNQPDILKLAGWDKDQFLHMRSDRRPEVVDFPIDAELAIEGLLEQFRQGRQVVFRYTTEAGETRRALFVLEPERTAFEDL